MREGFGWDPTSELAIRYLEYSFRTAQPLASLSPYSQARLSVEQKHLRSLRHLQKFGSDPVGAFGMRNCSVMMRNSEYCNR